MKGISTVVATLLMLIITIALAGLAYSYISGVFTARTAVILTVADTTCNTSHITVWVRNDGTTSCGTVTFTAEGVSSSQFLVNPGTVNSSSITRPTPTSPGYKSIRVSGCGSTSTGSVYCVS
jgi:flagellin-like protein